MEENRKYEAYINFILTSLCQFMTGIDAILQEKQKDLSINKLNLMFARDKIKESIDYLEKT